MRVLAFLILWVPLLAGQAIAAMDCVDSGQVVLINDSSKGIQVVTCTFDTTPGTAVDTIPANVMTRLDGSYWSIDIVPGATGPTENSDLQIVDSRGVTLINPTTSGLNVIDNTTSSFGILPINVSGSQMYARGHEPYTWTVTVTNNSVNNSSFIMYINEN